MPWISGLTVAPAGARVVQYQCTPSAGMASTSLRPLSCPWRKGEFVSDAFGLVEPDGRLDEGVVIDITDRSDQWAQTVQLQGLGSNGEVRQEFSILLTGRFTSGNPTPSSESKEVHWVEPARLTDLKMDRSRRRRLDHYQSRPTTSYFD